MSSAYRAEIVSEDFQRMTRNSANKRIPSSLGIFAPLRYGAFRRIWIASLLSNLGLLILGVGAAWAMTKLSSSTGMVALVQTSLMLPIALVSTLSAARGVLGVCRGELPRRPRDELDPQPPLQRGDRARGGRLGQAELARCS